MWGREEGWEGFKEVGVAQVSRSSGRWEWFSELGGASSACIGSGRGLGKWEGLMYVIQGTCYKSSLTIAKYIHNISSF